MLSKTFRALSRGHTKNPHFNRNKVQKSPISSGENDQPQFFT